MKDKRFRFQAHRGLSSEYPENTVASYRAAIDAGYDIIELDPKFTRDGVCVCFHDSAVNRTCRLADGSSIGEKTPVDSLSLDEIRALDAGLFKGERFRGERVPTLAEALAFIRDNGSLTVKIDNCYHGFSQALQEELFRVIEEADLGGRLAMTVKNLPFLEYVARRFPAAEIHYDGSLTPAALDHLRSCCRGRATLWISYGNALTSWCRERRADAEFCAGLHEYADVGIFTISSAEELARCYRDYGADVIETNGTVKPGDLSLV